MASAKNYGCVHYMRDRAYNGHKNKTKNRVLHKNLINKLFQKIFNGRNNVFYCQAMFFQQLS